MNVISEIIVGVLVLIGFFLIVVIMIGFICLFDMYIRSYVVFKSVILGVLFILVGCLFYFWIDIGYISVWLILVIVFVFIIFFIVGYLLGRVVYYSRVFFFDKIVWDDLKIK